MITPTHPKHTPIPGTGDRDHHIMTSYFSYLP